MKENDGGWPCREEKWWIVQKKKKLNLFNLKLHFLDGNEFGMNLIYDIHIGSLTFLFDSWSCGKAPTKNLFDGR